jgi:multidrug efflux pump subunit AcrA (membrane-fusion protein)
VSLAVPATAIQNDADGNEYIQVISNGSTQNVSVVSGQILADDTVVITGDLQVGDQVILLLQASNSTTGLGSGGGGFIMGR